MHVTILILLKKITAERVSEFIWFSSKIFNKYRIQTWVWSLGWEDPLEKEMATHSNILAGKSYTLAGYSLWGCKSQIWLSDYTITATNS